ncbi:MAG: alpha/beta hydrolase [Burkholderiales bacterium]|nr:alpha/beta hydrolase [Burkholderiales bacterium]
MTTNIETSGSVRPGGLDIGRRALLKATGTGIAALGVGIAATGPAMARSQVTLGTKWDKTFPKSDKVDHKKVSFKNRYGITLAADLYVPKRARGKLAALAVGGPFGAVKEQSSGLYAQTMAEREFITLAFDPSYTGESSGEPRNVASPDISVEDFSAAVDFLGLQPNVDRERIGVIGICGWGGMALSAAAVDKRIKAVVASTMYDMTRVMSRGYNDSMTLEQRAQTLEQLSQQRWKDAESGSPAYQPPYNELKGGEAPFLVEYHDYYRTPRGYHPRAVNSGNAWTITTPLPFMNLPILTTIKEISPRPILLVHGEKAHSRYFSETAYAAAAEPKELVIVPGAVHVDLYDRMDKIPFDELTAFFQKNLTASAQSRPGARAAPLAFASMTAQGPADGRSLSF